MSALDKPPRHKPARLTGMLESFSVTLVHHVLPWLLVPVFASGAGLVALFDLPHILASGSREDRIVMTSLLGAAVVGTVGSAVLLYALVQRDRSWRMLGMGRRTWIFLVSFVWLSGFVCGLYPLLAL